MKIIDNKKVNCTEDEWDMFQTICKSYDKPPSFKGSDLFQGLFESDDSGTILLIRPPSTRHTSMEAILFIMMLMMNQQLRNMNTKIDNVCANVKTRADALLKEIEARASAIK